MTQLSRSQAYNFLIQARCPVTPILSNAGVTLSTAVLMVGIGSAESDLVVEAQNIHNKDGSIDNGIWQINSLAHPQWDGERLRTDPLYCAQAAVDVLLRQGLRAWYAYQLPDGTAGPYLRKMPPGQGGADLKVGYSAPLLVKSWQALLNASTPTLDTPLVVDGGFGPKTEAATVAWKTLHHNDGALKVVNAGTWKKAGII